MGKPIFGGITPRAHLAGSSTGSTNTSIGRLTCFPSREAPKKEDDSAWPKMAQDGFKIAQYGFKMASRWLQDGFKMTQQEEEAEEEAEEEYTDHINNKKKAHNKNKNKNAQTNKKQQQEDDEASEQEQEHEDAEEEEAPSDE